MSWPRMCWCTSLVISSRSSFWCPWRYGFCNVQLAMEEQSMRSSSIWKDCGILFCVLYSTILYWLRMTGGGWKRWKWCVFRPCTVPWWWWWLKFHNLHMAGCCKSSKSIRFCFCNSMPFAGFWNVKLAMGEQSSSIWKDCGMLGILFCVLYSTILYWLRMTGGDWKRWTWCVFRPCAVPWWWWWLKFHNLHMAGCCKSSKSIRFCFCNSMPFAGFWNVKLAMGEQSSSIWKDCGENNALSAIAITMCRFDMFW